MKGRSFKRTSMKIANSSLSNDRRTFRTWLAEKLSRVTSTGELIPEIDGLRFIAITTVVLHHMMSILLPTSGRTGRINTTAEWFGAAEQFSPLLKLGYAGHFGVNLFFAISGFILALPFARKLFAGLPPPNLKSYYLRRVTRIEPPYAICMTIFFVYMVIDKHDFAQLLPHFLASLLYSHNLVYGQHSLVNVVTWSLEIEIQFYVLVPVLVKIFALRRAIARRMLLIGLILFGGWLSQNVIYPSGSERLALSLPNFFAYFLVGFLLADLYLTGWLRETRRWRFDLLTIGGGGALFLVLTRYGQFYNLLPALIGLFYLGFFRGRLSNLLVTRRWIVITGGMCYTFYLYHIPIISELTWNIRRLFVGGPHFELDFALQCLVVLPIVFALCSLWFVLTEKPFMRWSLSPKPAPRIESRPDAELTR
ncbi:MAG: acyltransferase [Blastocatellia bacterium]|nr:acyltransferase [Blastocatellia bacterium]